ncbi:uncharacterized protein RAG0_00152 [Rhynchosporium agropyri]|uniref:Uncharacterized protein n=1 Tax=Rhynchosporium agropyri TaxID=914238 RepID=A0A1E1JVX6_9HELO|nr:uncharacterized protein RAG0_00152 [Rhynchosporium agropyri]
MRRKALSQYGNLPRSAFQISTNSSTNLPRRQISLRGCIRPNCSIHPSKSEAIIRIYQMQEAEYTSNLPCNKTLQPVMAMSDPQMVGVPWDFRQSQHTSRFNPDPSLPEDTVLSQTWPSYVRTCPPPPYALQRAPPAVTRHEGATVSPQQGLSGQSLRRELSSVQVQVTQPPQSDPQNFCCQCGSLVHQLKHHPNPNTPEGYLRGCVHCNSLDHRLTTCPHRDMFADNEWYYLRECRTGLCPVEDFRDFKEIHRLDADGRLEYSVETHLPLTPRWALGKKYGKESRFQHPLEGGELELREDPFWSSADLLIDLGGLKLLLLPLFPDCEMPGNKNRHSDDRKSASTFKIEARSLFWMKEPLRSWKILWWLLFPQSPTSREEVNRPRHSQTNYRNEFLYIQLTLHNRQILRPHLASIPHLYKMFLLLNQNTPRQKMERYKQSTRYQTKSIRQNKKKSEAQVSSLLNHGIVTLLLLPGKKASPR